MGAARLRDGALTSAQVIGYINAHFVPVWINIRKQPWPQVPATRKHEWLLLLSPTREALSPASRGFFIRSYIISSDEQRLLNDDDGMVRRTLADWQLYLSMLQGAVMRANAPTAEAPSVSRL